MRAAERPKLPFQKRRSWGASSGVETAQVSADLGGPNARAWPARACARRTRGPAAARGGHDAGGICWPPFRPGRRTGRTCRRTRQACSRVSPRALKSSRRRPARIPSPAARAPGVPGTRRADADHRGELPDGSSAASHAAANPASCPRRSYTVRRPTPTAARMHRPFPTVEVRLGTAAPNAVVLPFSRPGRGGAGRRRQAILGRVGPLTEAASGAVRPVVRRAGACRIARVLDGLVAPRSPASRDAGVSGTQPS
jgi:hypothetical protein